MSKNTLGIFKEGKYALQRSRDFLAQLPNDDGILYSASCSHFYAAHKPPTKEKQAFLATILDMLAGYISDKSLEKSGNKEAKESETKDDLACDSKINAAFALSEFLETGGYYKEVLVEKLNRQDGWKVINGRLAKIACCYLRKERGFEGCDFSTPLGRSMTVKKWRQTLVAQIKQSEAEFEDRVKPYPKRWTDFNTIKYLKENPDCTTLVIPTGYETVDSRSFLCCMAGIEQIIINSPIDSLSGYDFLQCPDLRSLIINGEIDHLEDISSFSVLDSLTTLTIQDRVKKVLQNSLKPESLEHLRLIGGVGSIGKAALSNLSACSVIQLGEIKGMTAATHRSIVIPAVNEVKECAFLGSNGVQAVILGSGVKSVKSLAFSKCPNLSLAIIHDDVKDVESNAFFGCEGLKLVVAPDPLVKGIQEFYLMEFGYEKAEGVHFIPSSEIAKHQALIEQHLSELNATGITIGTPNWDEWNVAAPAQTDDPNPFANETDEEIIVIPAEDTSNPFGPDTDEDETAEQTADSGNPFGPGRLSDISAIASVSQRSSRANSMSSETGLGNPF